MNVPSFQEVEEARKTFLDLQHRNWLENNLFSFDWWLLLFLLITPWMIWWRLANRKMLLPLLLYGMVVALESILLDLALANSIAWGYPKRLLDFFSPILLPYDLTVLPVIFMLLYQYFSSWKGFIISQIITAALFSFVVEPLLEWMEIYQTYTWNSLYSFPLYILVAIIPKLIIDHLLRWRQNEQNEL